MIFRVRANRVLYSPTGEVWARGGDCFKADMGDPVLSEYLKRNLNKTCEWVPEETRRPLVDVPVSLRKPVVTHTQAMPSKRSAKKTAKLSSAPKAEADPLAGEG